MRLILDTCVISDFIKGDQNTLKNMQAMRPCDLGISTVTLFELEYGLALNPSRTRKIRSVVKAIIASVSIVEFDEIAAKKAAEIRADLKKKGMPIGPYDLLIAATALRHDCVLVSANQKEFSRIKHLKTIDWRQ